MALVRTSMVLALLLSLVACKKNETAAPSKEGEPSKTAAPAAKAAPDFSAWDPAGKAKAWVGSWVVMDNGSWQAWSVAADGKVSVREGDADKSFKLEVESPCNAYFATESGMKFPHPFTVMADGLVRSSGMGGGFRKGNEAIFCDGSGAIFILAQDGKCTVWNKRMDWEKGEGSCSISKNAEGKDVFKYGGPNSGEIVIEGDAIFAGQTPTERFPDHEAAKTAAAAKNAAK